MSVDWNSELAEQLDWHWREALRPRFDGLTDDEYFWEPVPGMWSIRPRGTSGVPAAPTSRPSTKIAPSVSGGSPISSTFAVVGSPGVTMHAFIRLASPHAADSR